MISSLKIENAPGTEDAIVLEYRYVRNGKIYSVTSGLIKDYIQHPHAVANFLRTFAEHLEGDLKSKT